MFVASRPPPLERECPPLARGNTLNLPLWTRDRVIRFVNASGDFVESRRNTRIRYTPYIVSSSFFLVEHPRPIGFPFQKRRFFFLSFFSLFPNDLKGWKQWKNREIDVSVFFFVALLLQLHSDINEKKNLVSIPLKYKTMQSISKLEAIVVKNL